MNMKFLFLIAIVAALVQSESCADKGSFCSQHKDMCGKNPGFDGACKKTCGKCGDDTFKCVVCLTDYFGDLEDGVAKDEAVDKLDYCRADRGITKEKCDADPCYQNDYKTCRKENKGDMSFKEWSEKCVGEAMVCAKQAKINKDFCEVDARKCQEDLAEFASAHCDSVEQCMTSVPVAIKCVACVAKDEIDEECLEKAGITAEQCKANECADGFLHQIEYCDKENSREVEGCEDHFKRELFDCAEGPRRCMVSKDSNEVGYQFRRECCSEANSVWDKSFSYVIKCCKHGTDPNTADGCTPPLPCIKGGETLPQGRECCATAKAKGTMCVEKPRVCVDCDCGHWDGKNYSRCIPRPRSECGGYCVKCENDGVTPMKGLYTKHRAECAEYAKGNTAEAQLKDLLRELLF